MNLEPITQSEVNQKNKYILMHIYGIQKNNTNEPICKEGMQTKMQRMDLWTRYGKERLGQMEKITLTCRLPCVKWIAGREAAERHREPSLVLCDDPVGWDGKEAQE